MQRIGVTTKSQTKATKHGLVILAQYKDVPFKHSREDFVDMLTKEGYDRNGATGSAMEYFNAQFGNSVDFSFEVSAIVTLPSNRKYYGENNNYGQDARPAEMIYDACQLADQSVDFSLYDDDNDGYVDNVFVFFAGGDEAELFEQEDLIWSHAWYMESGGGLALELDGKSIDRYACTAELSYNALAGIGTFCHEYSHTFGLPDFYDTDYDENGRAAGLWCWTSLMDGGNMNNDSNTPPFYNAIEREFLDIADPILIERDGTYTLEPLHSSNKFYRINTETSGLYYLIECRRQSGWDKYINGSGMLIYKVDKTPRRQRRWVIDNTVNAYADQQCADLVEADGRNDVFNSDREYSTMVQNIKGVFFPNKTTETIEFTPEISMTNIRMDGDNVVFSIVGFSEESTPPTAVNLKVEAFMDAAIINFESSWEFEGNATVTWGRTDQLTTETEVEAYEPGKYSLILDGLTPGNKTYTVSVHFQAGEISGEKRSTSFMTSKAAPVDWPYIFVGKNKALEDGSYVQGTKIALMVYNASQAEEIRWTFNDEEIAPEGDGYFTLENSGTLRAHVSWEDGSEDIIQKKINITDAE
jgi:M6 family metalloprotease-like protein